MGFGRIGGVLVVGGCVLFMIAVAIAMGGGSVGLGGRDAGGVLAAASLALLGSGAAVLSVAGPRPLNGRAVRVGLGILAVGLLSSLASSIMEPPMFVLLIVGLLASVLGSLITGLSLVRRPGPSRAVGLLFLAGMLLFVLTTLYAQPLQAIAGALVVLGGTGVGVLAINDGRSATVASV
ncbi:MAG TPA: hypothetical protein VF302_12005 [Candidatus Limnocylindrales bacterium]